MTNKLFIYIFIIYTIMKTEVHLNKPLAVDLESDIFNVGGGFVIYNILKPMVQIDRYEMIAQYGEETIDEDKNLSQNSRNLRRIEALDRYISTLILLISNTKFVKRNRYGLDFAKQKLDFIYKHIPMTYKILRDEVSSEEHYVIDEVWFRKFIDQVRHIKDEIYSILNRSGLIFRRKEGLNISKIEQDFINRG